VSIREEFKQVLGYTEVLSMALLEVFRRRAAINLSIRYEFKKSFMRYLTAVEALHTVLLPSLRPDGVAEVLEGIRHSEPSLQSLRRLDSVVEAMLQRLDKAGILVRKESLLTGTYGGGDVRPDEDY